MMLKLVAARKIAAKGAEQYMLRLPLGLRNRVARRAAANGRSMNTEIVDAVQKHLAGGSLESRVTALEAQVVELMRSRDASFVVR